MKRLLAWWFAPKGRASIIKIPIGIVLGGNLLYILITGLVDLNNTIEKPPQYLGISYLLPSTITSFIGRSILWGVLFLLPYWIFRTRIAGKERLLALSLLGVLMIVGSCFLLLYTKPGVVDITSAQLAVLESRLGQIDASGEFYTVREYGNDVARLTKTIPDFLLSEDEGFSPLVLFYEDCEKEWRVYTWLPSEPPSIREDWRKEHVEAEAMILFWGLEEKSVFYKGTKEGQHVSSLLMTWFTNYHIDRRMHPAFANWTLLP